MAIIKWRDSYSVGVEKFDKEHLILVELANDMYVIVRDKGDVTALIVCVEKLIEYTKHHFSSEEIAMEEAYYPGFDEHVKLHADLEKQAVAFLGRIKTEGEAIRTEFYHFLREWLLNHMVKEDKKYSEYLKPS
jgi:hemerythrin-like metal-binding protein